MKIWTDLDHRLSVVKRWGTIPKLHEQSVAEHCFNVQRLAVRLAVTVFGISDPHEMFLISEWALHHDDLESIMGDPPGMVKPYIDETMMQDDHRDLLPPVPPIPDRLKQIVKLADMLDGLWFLYVENSMGNHYINSHIEFEPERIKRYADKTWDSTISIQVNNIVDKMRRETSQRHSRRGR